MKKGLIITLLVASAALASRVGSALDSQPEGCKAIMIVASPIFWRVWDALLTHELAQFTQAARDAGIHLEWQPELRNHALTCFFLHVVLERAFEGLLPNPQQKNNLLVSIWGDVIRRTVEPRPS